MSRRDPPLTDFQDACRYLESRGFKLSVHRFGPKSRVDLSWPDDRRGIRLPEWRVVEIAEEVRAQTTGQPGANAARCDAGDWRHRAEDRP